MRNTYFLIVALAMPFVGIAQETQVTCPPMLDMYHFVNKTVDMSVQILLCSAARSETPLEYLDSHRSGTHYEYDAEANSILLNITFSEDSITKESASNQVDIGDDKKDYVMLPEGLLNLLAEDVCLSQFSDVLKPYTYNSNRRQLSAWVRVDKIMELSQCSCVSFISLSDNSTIKHSCNANNTNPPPTTCGEDLPEYPSEPSGAHRPKGGRGSTAPDLT